MKFHCHWSIFEGDFFPEVLPGMDRSAEWKSSSDRSQTSQPLKKIFIIDPFAVKLHSYHPPYKLYVPCDLQVPTIKTQAATQKYRKKESYGRNSGSAHGAS